MPFQNYSKVCANLGFEPAEQEVVKHYTMVELGQRTSFGLIIATSYVNVCQVVGLFAPSSSSGSLLATTTCCSSLAVVIAIIAKYTSCRLLGHQRLGMSFRILSGKDVD